MCAEPSTGWATMSYFPSLYCLRSSAGNAICGSLWLFLAGGVLEHARQIDVVELHRGLVRRLDRGLHAVGFPGRLLEGLGEPEAERGKRLRIGLFLLRAGERAVDPAGELHEDTLGRIDVRLFFVGGCAHDLSGLIIAILRSSSLRVRASWSRSSFDTVTWAAGRSR